MNVTANWSDSTKTVIVCTFQNAWNWYDCQHLIEQINTMQADSRQRVSIVFDFTDSRLTARKTIRDIYRLLNHRISIEAAGVVLVEQRLRVHLLINLIETSYRGFLPDNLYFSDTLTGAHSLIQDQKVAC